MKSLSLSQPHAIIMVGIPGSGKTHFAKKFADTFHAPRVSLEDIRTHALDDAAAATLVEQYLGELLKTNQSVVLELNTSSRQKRTTLARFIKDAGYAPLFVWVQTDTDTAKQRSLRAKTHDEESYGKQLRQFSAPHASESVLVISGKHTYASQAKTVLKRLSEPRAQRTQPTERTADTPNARNTTQRSIQVR